MSNNVTSELRSLLESKFDARNVSQILRHFSSAIEKFRQGDWEGTSEKAGKFVEAVAKALLQYCGKAISNPRRFSAGTELRLLENASGVPDTIRLVIPRAGIFVYEIVSNRGGRHDAHDIDANEMDAKVVTPVISWILAEMVRFCGSLDTESAEEHIETLTAKKYPFFEEIDGRGYVNLRGLSAPEIALLLLYSAYPRRIDSSELTKSVVRHGPSVQAAAKAVQRLRTLVDDDGGMLTLRIVGRERAEEILGLERTSR